ncbi:MAG: type IV pilus twitching motility protein PilT [Planctomycetota bacterium]|jgi:twitching motility protein PilT
MGIYDIHKLLDKVVEVDGSDLHIRVGRPPTLRVSARMGTMDGPPLKPEDTAEMAKAIMPQRNALEFKEKGGTDFGMAHGESGARFRVSIFRERGSAGIVMRLLPSRVLTFEQIGLPDTIRQLLHRPRGLLLVTGPTGSGKTTTLATMLDYINTNLDRHIVTIEDPIEYYHNHKKSIVTQREIGVDVGTFAEAMRRVLRMDPDVVLLGEMRDLDTIRTAVTAAETGHLVLATLHTTGSARTVDRIIDQFPSDGQEQIRTQLSVSVVAVISQVLLPKKDRSGQLAAFEIMVMTPAIENHIRKNETFKITSTIQTSANVGMILLDEFLLRLVKDGKIAVQDALEKAQNPRELKEKIRYLQLGEDDDDGNGNGGK